jgi:hypothetical protein
VFVPALFTSQNANATIAAAFARMAVGFVAERPGGA